MPSEPAADSKPRGLDLKSPTPAVLDLKKLTRSVVWNQLLFTAGYSLTSGGFLSYLAGDLGAGTKTISWILALPELVGLLAVTTPLLLTVVSGRKNLFLFASLLARCLLLLIPVAVFLPEKTALPTLITGMILTGIFQAIAYTAYLSWLSDLAPEQHWGQFFARRNLAHIFLLLCLPWLAALFRDYLRNTIPAEQQLLIYVGCFALGNLLQLASLWPLLGWPETSCALDSKALLAVATTPADHPPATMPDQSATAAFRRVLIFSWWLAIFQGLTQTPFFLYGYRELKISLSVYYSLAGLMYLIQLFTNEVAGRCGDRRGYLFVLMLSTWVTGGSLVFWILSLSGDWLWLWGAYICWGGFGAVNLSLQNLVLKTAPRHQNTLPIALYRFGSGGLAGLTGLIGGYWLDRLLQLQNTGAGWDFGLNPYFLLFVFSLLGRMTAPLWLLGIDESRFRHPVGNIPLS